MNTENTAIVNTWIKDLQATVRAIKNADEYGGIRMQYVKTAKKSDGYWYECRQSMKAKLTELALQIRICKLIQKTTIIDRTETTRTGELAFKSWVGTWIAKDFFSIVNMPLDQFVSEDPKNIRMHRCDTGQRGLGAKPYVITVSILEQA